MNRLTNQKIYEHVNDYHHQNEDVNDNQKEIEKPFYAIKLNKLKRQYEQYLLVPYKTFSDTEVKYNDIINLKCDAGYIIASNFHYNSGAAQWYPYPRLHNNSPQNLCFVCKSGIIKHNDQVQIKTEENLHECNLLGNFSYGVYYSSYYDERQYWTIEKRHGDGIIQYGDEVRFKNGLYYLQAQFSSKWKTHYLYGSENETWFTILKTKNSN